MKVIHITNNYTPYNAGVVHSINTIVQELQKKGHEVYIVTLDFLGKKHTDPIHVIRIPSIIRFRWKQNHMAIPYRPTAYLRALFQKIQPDIVHIHHPFLLGPIAAKLARSVGVKTVFTYHTQYEKYTHYVPLPASLTQFFINKKVINFCRNIDTIITPSGGIEQFLKKHQIMHVQTIPSPLRTPYDTQQFISKELKRQIRLFYAGRFTQEKNLFFLIRAVSLLPEHYTLTFAGFGQELDRLKDESLRLGFASRIAFIIKPSEQELLTLYKDAHIFLFPSQTDTQGLVLAEAMACSTPVVALDGIGQADSIRQGENGFIIHSEQEMAIRIMEIMGNSGLYRQMQKGAYETSKNYAPAQLVSRVEEVYDACIFDK